MKVHVVQHVQFEDTGSMTAWLQKTGATISTTRQFAGDSLPPVAGIDLVIIMGGPMSVNDEATFPWLLAEKQFIREAIGHGAALLGICLGAQLIANALGSRVYRNREKEIGWFPVRASLPARDTFRFPDEFTAFHWHGETFDLPPGAVCLASSTACDNQAFQVGRRIIGLQFHLETTPEAIAALLAHCSNELVPGPHIQPADRMCSVDGSCYTELNAIMGDVLAYLTGINVT